jgi:hypothetical protein
MKPHDKPYGKSDYVVGVHQEKQLFLAPSLPFISENHFTEFTMGVILRKLLFGRALQIHSRESGSGAPPNEALI